MQKLAPDVEARVKAHDYTGALLLLAGLKQPVDLFFDDVMVMAEDSTIRENRLALLGDLKQIMNRVADISKLAT
jgi:glycyl-tRNA synthetase beta chain